MIITGDITELRAVRWADRSLSWGLVPTMGFLHQGHLSLVAAAKDANDRVGASIFVNPMQFAPTEDLATYPRDLDRDFQLLRDAGVDLLFVPDNESIYPPGFQTTVSVADISRPLEGSTRPTHFQGVTTVVAKLFNIFQPDRAYFGQKDAQQTAVLRRMVVDLNFNLRMVICPTVREKDGLAMSSRNAYLSAEAREAAPVLYRALSAAAAAVELGERDGDKLRRMITKLIAAQPLSQIDYVSIADALTLQEADQIAGELLLSTAVYFGKTRLIDNIPLSVSSAAG